MRLFVNSDVYPAYRRQFDEEWAHLDTFAARRRAFLDDRYSAVHFLKPVLDGEEWAFFTNGDDEVLQRMWAREHGMARTRDLSTILLAQIEEHRTEVFYNFDPLRFPSNFVRRLPGTVKHAIAWRAAPPARADLAGYDLVVCNFASFIRQWRDRGWRAEYFFPSHDPVMDAYAARAERCIDVSFVGSYSRHHQRRAKVLTAVAQLSARYNVRFHLNTSRVTNIAEHPLASFLPIARFRRPRPIRELTLQPVFGRKLYDTLAIVQGCVECRDRHGRPRPRQHAVLRGHGLREPSCLATTATIRKGCIRDVTSSRTATRWKPRHGRPTSWSIGRATKTSDVARTRQYGSTTARSGSGTRSSAWCRAARPGDASLSRPEPMANDLC